MSWILTVGNSLSRVPPPSGKKVAFTFLVLSTKFWIVSLYTGVEVSRKQPVCREGASTLENPNPWSDGLSCRMHRLGVAFSVFGWYVSYFFWYLRGCCVADLYCSIASLVILGSMIEISDRAFGGVSTQAKLRWTTEKFREALIEISERADTQSGYTRGSGSVCSSQSANDSTTADTPTSSVSFAEVNFQHDVAGRATSAREKKQEEDSDIDVTKGRNKGRKPTMSRFEV